MDKNKQAGLGDELFGTRLGEFRDTSGPPKEKGSSDTKRAGSDLFIVDNTDNDWKVRRYLHDWCQLSQAIDIATGYFEIGSLLALDGEWQKVDQIRILMGDEVSRRTHKLFIEGLGQVKTRLNDSIELEKDYPLSANAIHKLMKK